MHRAGRAEYALLCFLGIFAAAIGVMAWRSAAYGPTQVPLAPVAAHAAAESGRTAAPTTSGGTSHLAATTFHSARSAPDRDIAELRSTITAGSSGTYIDFMLMLADSTTMRWPDRYQEPVRVWIQDGSVLEGWTPMMKSIARDAFGMWSSASVPVRFNFDSDSASAEIVILWQDHFEGARVGATRRFRDQHFWLGRAEITLALRTSTGVRVGNELLGAVAIHEAGHALGLDHSPTARDIMAEKSGPVFAPSAEDLATLALLYRIPPGSIR